jgi:hypothetical protein
MSISFRVPTVRSSATDSDDVAIMAMARTDSRLPATSGPRP